MADDDQYALCWNNFNKNLTAGFHSLYSRGDFTDVSLSAGGQVLKAHRMVLSVCSPYFQAMFESTPPTQHPIIFLKDISYKNLSDLVQFMYCGEVHVKQDDLAGFIAIAESLQIKGLTESGGETNVSPDNTKLDTTGSRPLRAAKRSRKKQELEEVSCTPVKMEKRTINSRIRPGKKLSTNSQDPLQQDITSIPSTSTAEFIEMDALHTKTEPTTYDDQDMDSSYLQGDDTFNAADLVEKDDNYDNTYSEAEDTHEDKQPKEELNNTDTELDFSMTISEKGKSVLVLNGFVYNKERSTTKKIIWKCAAYFHTRCRARVHLENGKITRLSKENHNHGRETVKIRAVKHANKINTDPLAVLHNTRNMTIPVPQTQPKNDVTPDPPIIPQLLPLEVVQVKEEIQQTELVNVTD